MIVVMKPGATAAEIGAVIRKAESLGCKTHPIYGDNRTVVALVGDLTRLTRETFDQMDGVLQTMRIQEPYKLLSRTTRPDNSIIDVAEGRVRIGGAPVVVMAGPCSVEAGARSSRSRTRSRPPAPRCCAAGAFKPRTSPYDFQGLGLKGLEYLADARAADRLPVITEVMREEQVQMVSEYADILQIGARNMQNYGLLQVWASSASPSCSSAASAARSGTADVRRVHRQQRQLQRDALRAGHPHLRDGDAQHLRPQRGAGAQAAVAPAGGGRPLPRHGACASWCPP
jgi:3-deoxy-7-phosphoheptulonate synthase